MPIPTRKFERQCSNVTGQQKYSGIDGTESNHCFVNREIFASSAISSWGINNLLNLQRNRNCSRNNWVVPTYMVSVEDAGLRGGGSRLKQKIWNAARDTISEWTGQELTECSLYGIRIYKEGVFPR